MHMDKMILSPIELDKQSDVTIDEWVDLDSSRWRDTDEDCSFTKKTINMLLGEDLFTDSLGRLWIQSSGGKYYPFHYEYGKKKLGVRIAKKASN